MKHNFKLKNAALLMALTAVYPMVAHSAAGIAQFTVGDVNVRRGSAAVPLSKGQAIESGDSIVTGGAGQAQLRFSDGGLVSLAPNSQFNISNYADVNDPGKDTFAVSLFRGGMRAITGLIGKRNRENYKVTTNTATIGIRGSAFSANYNADGSLNVAGEQDAIQVCTQAGCVDLTVGEIVRVSSSNTLPTRTNLSSNLPPLSVLPQTGALKNQPEFEIPGGVNGVLAGVSAIFVSQQKNFFPLGTLVGGADPSTGKGTFVNSLMTRHESDFGTPLLSPSSPIIFEQVGAGSSSFGTVGTATDPAFIGWGYWDAARLTDGGIQQSSSSGTTELSGVHYLVGRPTPYLDMPATGNANYTLVGGTNPTASSYTGGSIVGTLIGAGLNVNFSTGLLHAYVDTRFVSNNTTINVQIGDYGYVSGNQFYANDGSGSQGYFTGFFTGAQASRAGLVYYGYGGTVGDINGVAVFVKSASSEPITDLRAVFIAASGNVPTYDVGGFSLLAGNQLVMQHDPGDFDTYCYCGQSTLVAATGPVSSADAKGSPADHDFIGWGYWARGAEVSYGGSSSLTGVHYIVGKPTLNMPTDGTATYNLIGGTPPTATYNGQSIVGTLLSASLQVNFGSGNLQANVSTQFTKNNVTTNVSLVESAWISGNTFSGGFNCGGNVRGIFVGNAATRAGMVYKQVANAGIQNSGNPGNLGTVRGAVALQRDAIVVAAP